MTLALFGAAKAIDIETIVLKNGSEYHGYIQKQDGNGHISFRSDNATICISGKDVKSYSNEKKYKINELDSVWIKWAEKNDAFEVVGKDKFLTLFDVVLKDKTISKVYLVERGIKVKYHEENPSSYAIAWKDIMCIKCPKRSRLALSGLNTTYVLKTGIEYTGQYAEETDSTLSLYLNNGMIQTMNVMDVNIYTYAGINPNQSLFEQSPLLDVIRTKNGNLLKGIITEKNYTTGKDAVDYFTITPDNGSPNTIKIADIMETMREVNPSYSPLTDIVLETGDIRVNRKKTTIVNATQTNSEFRFDKVDGVAINKGSNDSTPVTIEYVSNSVGNAEQFQIVKLKPITDKKITSYVFTYEDIVNSAYHAKNVTTSVNNVTKAEYMLNGTGNYALFDSKSKKVVFINIK